MKCALCKGKGSFLVYKTNQPYDIFLGGTEYWTREDCPKCNGTGEQPYKSIIRRDNFEDISRIYVANYEKFFKNNYYNKEHDELITYLRNKKMKK